MRALGCFLSVWFVLASSIDAANVRGHQREFTFVDISGGYVGNTKCVDGMLYAQLMARNKNTPVAALPRFIQEYCEEDIALALGVPEKDFHGSVGKVWRAAFRAGNATALKGEKSHIFVSATNHVVEISADLSLKLDMSSKLCQRLSAFYKPGRFANRADALVYCTAVKKALSGDEEAAVEGIPLPKKGLAVLRSASAKASPRPKCPPGSTKVECGIDVDGNRINVDDYRSTATFKSEATRISMNTEVAARAMASSNRYASVVQKLEQLKALRDKKSARTVVLSNITLAYIATGDMTKRMQKQRVQNVLVVAISKAYGLDARDMKLERFHNTRGTDVYATTLSVAVVAGSDPATIERVLDGKQFRERVNKQIRKLQSNMFSIIHVEAAKTTTLHDVPQPIWFTKSISTKITALLPELNAAKTEDALGEKLVATTGKAMKAHVAAARAKTNSDSDETLLRTKAERLSFDQSLAEKRYSMASLDTAIARLNAKAQKTPVDATLAATLRVRRDAAEKELERAIQEERNRGDLGSLSNLAAELERKIEYSTSPVERAGAEARLAELQDHRIRFEREAKHAKAVQERLRKMQIAVKSDPTNKILRDRLERMLAVESREKLSLATAVKAGDRCAPCRTRVMGVMRGALNSGVSTKDIPQYMRSFCEVRLATRGNQREMRTRDSISRVCGKFESALKRNLDESETLRKKSVMEDSRVISEDGRRTNLDTGERVKPRRKASDDSNHDAAVHNYCIATSECIPGEVVHKNPGPRTTCERCAAELLSAVDNWKRAGVVDTAQEMSSKVSQFCVSRLSKTWTFGKDLIRETCARAMDKDGAPIFAPPVVVQVDHDVQSHNDLRHAFSFCSTVGECPAEKPLPDLDAAILVKEQRLREKVLKEDKKLVAQSGGNLAKCKMTETALRESLQAQQSVAWKCSNVLSAKKRESKDIGFRMEERCQASRALADDLESAQADVESTRNDLATLQKNIIEKQRECEVIKSDRARQTKVDTMNAEGKLIAETGKINREVADLRSEIASKGETSLLTQKVEDLEKASEHANKEFQELKASMHAETSAKLAKCAVEVKTTKESAAAAQVALTASYGKLNAVKRKTDATDKGCKDAVHEKGLVEVTVLKQGKKCTELDESVAQARKDSAVARAKCDAIELTKALKERQIGELDDDANRVTASAPTEVPANSATGASYGNFPQTVGDCSLNVLSHLDKVRAKTSHRGFWLIVSKWAHDTCTQMATASSPSGHITASSKIACRHAKSCFTPSSGDNDVRRAEKFCNTVHQFVSAKNNGPMYMRQPLLPVAPSIRPSKSELFYTFSPGAQINPNHARTLENPATEEAIYAKKAGHEPGHYYGLLASHVAREEARNKNKSPEEKLISRMEAHFVKTWERKQKSLGVNFTVIEEEDDTIFGDASGTGATGASTGATGASTGATGASTGATGAATSGSSKLVTDDEVKKEKDETEKMLLRGQKSMFHDALNDAVAWASKPLTQE
eukprot:Stramenopile-MAST_4_protein_1813